MPFLAIIVGALLLGVAYAFGAEPNMPDPSLTPGAMRDDLTVTQICKIKWGKDARAVTASMKKTVFVSYGFPKLNRDERCPCEIDHLVSRELGGADVIANLWPQLYRGPWNAHMKDRLENRLHKELCAGNLKLEEAHAMLRADWRKAFIKYFGEPK